LTAATSTDAYAAYAEALESGLELPELFRTAGRASTPYEILRQLRPIAELRSRGTFFTGSDIASKLWSLAINDLSHGAVIVDPACGAGDLLMPAISHVVQNGLKHVVVRAGDIDPDFARVAAVRLRAAMPVGCGEATAQESDFLLDTGVLKDATHVVLNPPFVPIKVQTDWASGNVNAAALFVLRALENMRPGARLLAVLPDVLRSGSRYEKWRRQVSRLALLENVDVLGVFDADTDVHVFLINAIVGAPGTSVTWMDESFEGTSVSDLFEVRVGPVVPHRDEEIGTEVEYVTARSLSAGLHLRRQYSGRLERGPMVLVNRTSRPGETPRVKARLRPGKAELAVENHLLVLVPKDGKLSSCRLLISVLEDPRTVDYLDNRIRCRHLTVQAVKGIPWLQILED
jgi:hypothetical protein